MISRLLSPFKELPLLFIAVGHIFFQALVILSQFGVAYIVAMLVENAHSQELLSEHIWQAYGLLGFLVAMIVTSPPKIGHTFFAFQAIDIECFSS